jgi:hypothetical protein
MYIELQKHLVDPAGVSYTYILRWNDSAFLVATCLEHDFDKMLLLLRDPKMGSVWLDVIKDTRPTAGRLLENGINARYSNGAVLVMEDPDYGENKNFVGTVVGNVLVNSVKELEEALLSDRMMNAYELVLGSSFTIMHEEISSSHVVSIKNKLKTFTYGMFHAQVEAIELASIWIPKLTNLFGK